MTHSNLSALTRRAVVSFSLVGFAATAGAQQVSGSATAAGLGGNFTALARGADAVAWNPAGLGLSGGPGRSIQALSLTANAAVGPITFKDLKEFQGKDVPLATRQEWLAKVTEQGGEKGAADFGSSEFAMSLGRFGFQVSSVGFFTPDLNPDAVEAILFGNAGQGSVRDLDIAGSSMRGGGLSTIAASYGMPIGNGGANAPEMAWGVTGKYVIGHGVFVGRGISSSTGSNISIDFPIVAPDTASIGDLPAPMGSGMGVDLGFSWKSGKNSLGVAVLNAVNTFKWDETKLAFRSGSATFDGTNSESDFDQKPLSSAPAALKDAITNNKLKPAINIGYARTMSDKLILSADAHSQMGDDDAIVIGPKTMVGVGVQYLAVPMLPLRAGLTYLTGGYQMSAGFGLQLGGYELGLAGSLRSQEIGSSTGVMINLIGIR
jgi:hypothetical protein